MPMLSAGNSQSISRTEDSSSPQTSHPSETLQFATVPSALRNSSENIEFVDLEKLPPAYLPSLDPSPPGSPPLSPASRANDDSIATEAKRAARTERQMTLWQGLRLYPKAIGWSLLLSLTLVMEGFDITLISSFYAFPSFKRNYGHLSPNGTYQIATSWQAALTNGALVGEIIGLFINGVLCDRFGNRRTMVGCLALLSGFIFISVFAKSPGVLLASQILCGIPWGVFQTLSITYAAECVPVALRAYLTSGVNLCWLIGQLISVGTLRCFTHSTSPWSYRIPFALQWMWAVPILVGILFAPESPWWLVRHERPEDARRALLRLTSSSAAAATDSSGSGSKAAAAPPTFNVDETVAMMQHTNAVEKYLSEGTSYVSCFRGSDLRRTEIACGVWMTQSICGVMTGYATYFYTQAGLATDKAFTLSTAMYGAGIAGVVLSWFLMRVAGRRTLYLWGAALCAAVLGVAGCVGTRREGASPAVGWALGSLVVLTTFVYDSSIGPICYSLVAEIPSTRLRVKTVVLARVAYNVLSIITNVLMPQLLNPNAWNWKGKTCFLWAAGAGLAWVWCFFRLPEPKGLTYMELDLLFEKKADARKFSRVQASLSESGYFSVEMGGSEGAVKWHEECIVAFGTLLVETLEV
ncbi:sugar transporter [Glonium stellatum]|uniref:Sugar transporter n=1 Tax=Glonium stellatum TaxID=574774 RepID=A0A8E2JX36_9PEZI|nr:sugar transporter [Glonium stellatum]